VRKLGFLVGVLTAAGAVASPAVAQPAGDTTITFTVSAAELSISVPASHNAGSGSPGDTLTAAIGAVTVTDERAVTDATWTATVTATAFTTGGAGAQETVAPDLVSYWSGPASATTGDGTFVPGQPTATDAATLSVPRTAFSKSSGGGNNSATWNPTLQIAIPADALGGLYSGTVTHSVA
jgi:hypothetical protein